MATRVRVVGRMYVPLGFYIRLTKNENLFHRRLHTLIRRQGRNAMAGTTEKLFWNLRSNRNISTGGQATKENFRESLKYCEDLVKRHENDYYLCALLAPEGTYAALITLRAFNIETARVKDSITNPTMGTIRLQWWADAIDSLYCGEETSDLLKQPVTAMLYILLRRYHFPKEQFLDVLEAREEDMSSDPPATVSDLLSYGEKTQGSLNELALHTISLMDKDYNNSAKAVRHAGRFTGMTTLIRSTPFLATRGLTYLPKQLLDENNVSIESIKESASMGTLSDPLKVIVQTLADRALEELEAARALRPHITRDVALLTLPALASEHYLFRLRKNNFEVFDPAVIEPIGFDPLKLRLWIRWSAWRGVF